LVPPDSKASSEPRPQSEERALRTRWCDRLAANQFLASAGASNGIRSPKCSVRRTARESCAELPQLTPQLEKQTFANFRDRPTADV